MPSGTARTIPVTGPVRRRIDVTCQESVDADARSRRHLDTAHAQAVPLTHPETRTTMPFANFKVPAGTLDEKQKEEIVTRTTELYVEIYGERARANTMVLVEEVTDGGWGIGGNVLTLAMLAQSPED
jgi:4-oxalocrotonate tautomerase